ncbi:hypothetical protein OOK31_36575 [Streptomyces sp. NBC_00249]|nr:hypothetical protein [Streptomyces sp. NBC_00249]
MTGMTGGGGGGVHDGTGARVELLTDGDGHGFGSASGASQPDSAE